MEDLRDINNIRGVRQAIHRERVFRDRFDPFDNFDETDFRYRYRISKELAARLIDDLHDELEPLRHVNMALSPRLKVLLALRFYATGTFQRVCGDLIMVSQATACRVVKRVSVAIARLKPRYLTFPQGNELANAKRNFIDLCGMPDLICAIDCTHILIKSPGGDNAGAFINRKGFYSINVQMVCDTSMRITNIVARWHGSAHDYRIFENSNLRQQLQQGAIRGILLGDNGYACSHYLLTPLLNPQTAAQQQYNAAHKRGRSVIERLFGILKKRFPCLQLQLRNKLDTIKTIIVATAVLHNIAVDAGDPVFEFEEDVEEDDNNKQAEMPRGLAFRQAFINQHFN